MCKTERFFVGLFLGSVFPLTGFLAGWWLTLKPLNNVWILMAALGGLLLGVFIDLLFLKRWVASAYEIGNHIWMVAFVFYSICVFGFFMGVPVFNLFLAIPAGWLIGRKLAHNQITTTAAKPLIQRTALFTTGVLALICTVSALLALRDSSTAANLEGMLRLNFDVTQDMIITLIVVGGAALLTLNWCLVKMFIRIGRG